MTGYFMDISPGRAEGRRIWICPNGLIVVGMAIFYVDMWKSGINDVFAFLDERVADEQRAPSIDDLWQEINERFGEMLINFRIALLDAQKKRVSNL